jgi:protein-S-isoprenylcysteine O-methyltransferase Ste14
MTLRDQFARSGNRLFRWRSYAPLLVLALVLSQLPHFRYPENRHVLDQWWELGCLLVSFAGFAIRILTVGHVPGGTSARETRRPVAARLNTTGMYSIVRHPLYLGNVLISLGIVLFPRMPWLAALSMLLLWIYYERIMYAEEEFLRAKFGRTFLEWAQRTPAFIPRPGLWRPPSLPFCIRSVLRREYSGFFAIVTVFSSLELLGDLAVRHRVVLDGLWLALFGVALVAYITLRSLKHHTTLLNAPGR